MSQGRVIPFNGSRGRGQGQVLSKREGGREGGRGDVALENTHVCWNTSAWGCFGVLGSKGRGWAPALLETTPSLSGLTPDTE